MRVFQGQRFKNFIGSFEKKMFQRETILLNLDPIEVKHLKKVDTIYLNSFLFM